MTVEQKHMHIAWLAIQMLAPDLNAALQKHMLKVPKAMAILENPICGTSLEKVLQETNMSMLMAHGIDIQEVLQQVEQ